MSPQLFFVNVPYDFSDLQLKDWIESRGFAVESVRIIRDVVSGISPAFAYAVLKYEGNIEDVVTVLNGRKMWNQTVTVTSVRSASASGSRRVMR